MKLNNVYVGTIIKTCVDVPEFCCNVEVVKENAVLTKTSDGRYIDLEKLNIFLKFYVSLFEEGKIENLIKVSKELIINVKPSSVGELYVLEESLQKLKIQKKVKGQKYDVITKKIIK